MINNNSCIRVEYDAFTIDDNRLIDTTNESKAKKTGLHQEGKVYEPLTLIVGKGFMVNGVEESFKDKKVGDEYEIIVPPEKGFGFRDMKNTINMRIKEFKEQEIDPVRGMMVTIDGQLGKIIFVSPGRFARVDFNHPLAGKTLKYRVKIIEEVKEPVKVIKCVTDFLLGKDNALVEYEKGKAVVKTKKELSKPYQKLIKDAVKETLKKGSDLSFIIE